MAVTLPQVPLIFTQVSANGISGLADAANQIKFCDFAKLAGGEGGARQTPPPRCHIYHVVIRLIAKTIRSDKRYLVQFWAVGVRNFSCVGFARKKTRLRFAPHKNTTPFVTQNSPERRGGVNTRPESCLRRIFILCTWAECQPIWESSAAE